MNGDGPLYIAPAVAYSGNGNNNGETVRLAAPSHLSLIQRATCLSVYMLSDIFVAILKVQVLIAGNWKMHSSFLITRGVAVAHALRLWWLQGSMTWATSMAAPMVMAMVRTGTGTAMEASMWGTRTAPRMAIRMTQETQVGFPCMQALVSAAHNSRDHVQLGMAVVGFCGSRRMQMHSTKPASPPCCHTYQALDGILLLVCRALQGSLQRVPALSESMTGCLLLQDRQSLADDLRHQDIAAEMTFGRSTGGFTYKLSCSQSNSPTRPILM